jgi:hypothetical protein
MDSPSMKMDVLIPMRCEPQIWSEVEAIIATLYTVHFAMVTLVKVYYSFTLMLASDEDIFLI